MFPNRVGSNRPRRLRWLSYDAVGNAWRAERSELAIYFADALPAGAFVARWCAGSRVETPGGVFQVREDEPMPRVGAGVYRTP